MNQIGNNIKNWIFEFVFKIAIFILIKKDLVPNNYKYFCNKKEIDDWGITFNNYFLKKEAKLKTPDATEEDKKEMKTLSYYTGYIGEQMNGLLRGDKEYIFPDLIEHIEILSKLINKFKLSNNVIVVRRVPCKYIDNNVKKGYIYTDNGFVSTSLNLSYRLNHESIFCPLKNEALIILKIPNGTNACYIEQVSNRGEYELILQKKTKMIIEKNIIILGNRIILAKVINT